VNDRRQIAKRDISYHDVTVVERCHAAFPVLRIGNSLIALRAVSKL
jgi:hypothetical protein